MRNVPIFKTKEQIPQTLGKLQYIDFVEFEDKCLGIQLRYSSADETKADIYLYNLGRTDIPNDIESPQVEQIFQESCNGILLAADRGMLLDLEIKASQYLHLFDDPKPAYLWAAFYYRQAASPFTNYEEMRYSHLALRTDDGCISKVRYTYPDYLAEDASVGLAVFLADYYTALQKHIEN